MRKLTELDYRILGSLRDNPRATNKSIAQKLQVNEATAAARIRKMEQQNILRIVPMQDFSFVSHNALAILDIHVSGRPIEEVAAELARIDQAISVVIMSGTPALIISVTERDPMALMHLAVDPIGRIDGVRSIQTNYVAEIVKWSVGHGLLTLADGMPSKSGDAGQLAADIDDLDRLIIDALLASGRISNRQVAKIVDTSEHTVRQRLRKMEEIGLVQFALVVDAPALNMEAAAYVRISTHSRYTRDVARAIGELESCFFVGFILGHHDIVAFLVGESRPMMMSLISERIGGLTGVNHYEVREPTGYSKYLHNRAHILRQSQSSKSD